MDPILHPLPHLKCSIISTLNSSFFVFLTFLGLIGSSSGAASPSPSYYYNLCAPFLCGGINFTFPFSDSTAFGSSPIDCGLPKYQISCDTNSGPSLEVSTGRFYRLKTFFPDPDDRVITVTDTQLISDLRAGSCESLQNLTIRVANLSLPQGNVNLTFFRCSNESSPPPDFLDKVVVNKSCREGGEVYLMVNITRLGQSVVAAPEGCKLVGLPVSVNYTVRQLLNTSSTNTSSEQWEQLLTVLSNGFQLVWSQQEECQICVSKGGRCGYELGKVVCLCEDGCGQKKSSKRPIIIGIASGSSSLLVIIALYLLIYKKVPLVPRKSYFAKEQPSKERVDAENFIRTYRSTLLTGYSYRDLKKMANGFKEKLGEGGYGNVYKGKLLDGRVVAVKVLDKSGSEGPKQALVYEYMPNGSLADLLGKKGASLQLGMEKLLEIAIGVAHGIAYLHGGCESRILHLDIKPQNILLDQNLIPKISDFGLAKIYSRHRSAITVTGPRGTYGFIAPEIFMRNLGNPSHKSDVYSFGMLLLEMAGARTSQAEIKANASSSESYFPEWIYDRLNQEKINTECSDSLVEENSLVSRKMLMVGIWCIQVNPRDRPSMPLVLEMLSGSVEDIKMPPRPCFFSPPRIQLEELHSLNVESSSSLPLRLESFESHCA
ncbi:LEAF RUST 10 DISEASE-RESISTANCE LOCUS RECEPTOR-LIKE PROTEIN KINASE-like 2.1 isoform X2 [Punica granatum]|uniref:LEAF RUST 10 DISEASE-RESISTANCE LOCUS RECEPTOR-LIKE PROTEIN KINASE-like 2.1 isoform X2 n=1 Tax=Punica granatum TaxID=22663 RepID=A0A6P8CY46_PUNGR|nr:LEAF RUST 10 DISEASE-RESISTANCE LOCUS RECEPTOR-LIKE PROTEIN KINASE-like 2.1 isoform X2 [Punica granatum]